MRNPHTCSLFSFVALVLTACSGDGDERIEESASPDAGGPREVDAAPGGTAATVVDCAAATPAADVWYYSGVGFVVPTSPIKVGEVVRFHDLESHTADHVLGLWTASGNVEVCVRFDGIGGYDFRCYFHAAEQFTIVVE